MHQPEYKQFVDEIPLASLQTLYSAFQGNIPDKATVGLACMNVASYAAGLGLGQPGGHAPVVMMGSAPEVDVNDSNAVHAAFRSVLPPNDQGMQASALPPGTLKLLLGIAMKIFMELLG